MLGKGTIQRKEIGQRFKDKQRDYDHGLIFRTLGSICNVEIGPVDKMPSDLLPLVEEWVGWFVISFC